MKTTKNAYQCSECGWSSVRWVGRCGECQQWGTVAEAGSGGISRRIAPVIPLSRAVPITRVDETHMARHPMGIGELDRVLGGGLAPGAVVLLAGEPGIGKSTLLLEAASRWAKTHGPTLYVTGEESAGQVKMRAARTHAETDALFLAAETDVSVIMGHIDQIEPSLVVVDSIQTIGSAQADGVPGGVSQVKEVTSALIRVAKQRGLPIIIVGHVTKDGTVAGPKTLEHLVDVVASFEGDRHSGFRLVRCIKNRFGPADEVGCFELTDSGIQEVPDPSGVFTGTYGEPVSGTALTVAMEGRRPLVTEIQSLVAVSAIQSPRRVCSGVDGGRLAMVLAVLQRRARLKLHTMDVYASTVGGARVFDPGADLALACAVASAVSDQPMPEHTVCIGEVGLAGEVRRAPDLAKRLMEAARLGATSVLVPQGSEKLDFRDARLDVIPVPTVSYALNVLGLERRKG